MTQLKTQCPICDALFALPEKAVGNPQAKARCKHCQSIFLVNEHIYQPDSATDSQDSLNETAAPDAAAVTAASGVRPTFSKDSANEVDEYGLGDMDWRNDASTAPRHPATNLTKQAINQDVSDATNSDAGDAWLNDLLDEELPVVSDSSTNTVEDNDLEAGDLTDLLSEFGVESITPAVVTREEVLAKINARLDSDRATQRHIPGPSPMAKLFWIIGCLALALLLFAQYVIFNVDKLVKDPANASKLASVC